MLEVITCMLAGILLGAPLGAAVMHIRWSRWLTRQEADLSQNGVNK